jgi:hypothetical protein
MRAMPTPTEPDAESDDAPPTTAAASQAPQGASPLRLLGMGTLVVLVAWLGVLAWRLVR